MKDVSNWIAPPPTANDSIDGNVSYDIVVTYSNENGNLLTDMTAVRAELTAGRRSMVREQYVIKFMNLMLRENK